MNLPTLGQGVNFSSQTTKAKILRTLFSSAKGCLGLIAEVSFWRTDQYENYREALNSSAVYGGVRVDGGHSAVLDLLQSVQAAAQCMADQSGLVVHFHASSAEDQTFTLEFDYPLS